ncbi:MAG: Eco57I restriction-modification methylase domain-containing protein [Candidatus Cloacimonetes bacterium]|nr:Eco57I restriction-modification methylase domain-containing protein [Candidatus Cloacimonadota bacterium]
MNEIINWRTDILPILEEIRDKGADINVMRSLFIERLNYDFTDKKTLIEFPERIKENVLSTKIISEKNGFKVLFCTIDSLLKGIELPAVKTISRYYPANLIIFTNKERDEAHFINTKFVGKERDKKVKGFRRITIGKTDRLRTASERLSKIYAYDGISTLALMSKCEEAFDVEAVSTEFYKEFVKKYKELRNVIRKNNKQLKKGVDDSLTQEITNRLLFLYFIQKKGWLNGDYRFLYNNFQSSKKEYYKNSLVPLFKKLSIKDFKYPEFENIPFINGGLFESENINEDVFIPNQVFQDIFEDLLERFNFTIREDTEFEEEIAIDPEMLGKIFEQLILSIESEKYKDIPDARRGSGSYYTPRFIVSFMVKQSLLNYLTNELPEIPKEKLKSLIFCPPDKRKIIIDEIDNPKAIRDKLLNLRIVDPGVGSGAFAVDILNKLVSIIEKLNEKLGIYEDRYNLRKKLIEDCIYGVDIQPRAVHLARLRLWLSLIVEQKLEKIEPLINLDFKILKGNSLISKICGFKFDLKSITHPDQKILELIEKFKELKDDYSEAINDIKKKILNEKIFKTKCDIAIWHLENIKKRLKEKLNSIGAQLTTLIEKTNKEIREEEDKKEKLEQEISILEKEIEKIKSDQEIDAFNWQLDFFEVMGVKEGFDIVIANPPYGVGVEKEVYKDEFELGSKDSYGVFAALGVNILKPGGTLCYIMSDTWQTIRTHKKLREKIFNETKAQYLISVPMKTFKATVNTGIYFFKKSAIDKKKENFIIAADFHNLDIKNGDLEAAFDMIIDIEPDEKHEDGYTEWSDREMAIYAYRQKIIERFSNLSFFIASPKLFKLMQDVGNLNPKTFTDDKDLPVMFDLKKQKTIFDQNRPDVYQVNFNRKIIELVKLGDIAEVKQGLATADNDYYLRQLPGTRGSYKEIDLNLVLKEEELEKIRKDEKLRLDVIENGICTNPDHKSHKHRYFSGRYFVPYDKGGASDIEEGWLPNYYVPTPYFIDWSKDAIKRMKTLTIADIRKKYGEPVPSDREYYKTQIAAVFRNTKTYFKDGITFSDTGYYAPTYRFNTSTLYDVMGMSIFPRNPITTINQLASKVSRYFIKNFINSTVHSQIEGVKKIPIFFNIPEEYRRKLSDLVSSIIQHQKQNPRYDYIINEQVEIDKLIYEMYNLNEEDIKEVENWYFRRYPKLAKIIERKLKRKK